MAAQSSSPSPQDGSGGGEFSDNLVLQAPQPMREDYIQNAVNFLGHPKVKGSPVFYRRSFLEKKGLTKEEIDEAFRRDPQPNSTDVAAVGSQQASIPNQSAGTQPYKTVQSPQAVTSSVSTLPIVPQIQPQLSWPRTLIGVGVFLGVGASAAVVLKKWFIPRLKSWTQRAHAEGAENSENELTSKLYEEIKEAIQASASAFSDIAKTNQELLASKDEDKKILTKMAQAFDSQAEAFRSLSESLNRISENRFSQYNIVEDHFQSAPWNGPTNNSWRASQQINTYNTSPRSDFDSGRHPYMPVPGEPTSGAFPSRSYVEQQQQRMQRPGYGYQPQMSNDRWSPGTPLTNYHGSPPPYQYHHGANTIDEAPAPAPAPALAPPAESPFQRHWVPPQPPGVVMPEAAAAIRQPRQQGSAAPRSPENAATEQPQPQPESTDDVAGGVAMASAGNGEAEQEREAAA
uniref:Peroxisomal membrane protein PEX14 n=1 Tax=Leersia perrieri TaxID=77586 RepID=A0A0D9UVV1_9ORYZ